MAEKFIIPFGQYKGQEIDLLVNDQNFRNYCDWAINQPNIKEKYPAFCQIVVNNFSPPQDTPEHNILQNRFLDNNFCLALGKLCNWKLMKKNSCIRNLNSAISKALKMSDNNDYEWKRKNEKIEELKSKKEFVNESVFEIDGIDYWDADIPFFEIKTIFEQDGWDVIIQADDSACRDDCEAFNDCYINLNKIAVEIKPSVGDDYPAILRQMKMTRIHPDYQCLIYENFNAIGATIDQFKSVFESSGFKVFSFADIEKVQQELNTEKTK
jgi:hypothetical protein